MFNELFTVSKQERSYIEVILEFEKSDGDIITIAESFSNRVLEDGFIELLIYLLTKGETEYQDWFSDYIYIPHESGEPMLMIRAEVRKIENGQINIITLSNGTDVSYVC